MDLSAGPLLTQPQYMSISTVPGPGHEWHAASWQSAYVVARVVVVGMVLVAVAMAVYSGLSSTDQDARTGSASEVSVVSIPPTDELPSTSGATVVQVAVPQAATIASSERLGTDITSSSVPAWVMALGLSGLALAGFAGFRLLGPRD